MLWPALLLVGLLLVPGHDSAASCPQYNAQCSPKSPMSCCYAPLVLCLPNRQNSSSCLSPLDTQNLSPSLLANPLFAPLQQNFLNATSALLGLFPNITQQFPANFG